MAIGVVVNSGLDNSEDGDVVASLLGDLLAVVVAIGVVVVSSVGLADSHHHILALLVEGHLDGLGDGGLFLRLVGAGADLVVDLLSALGTDGEGDGVALLDILDMLLQLSSMGVQTVSRAGVYASAISTKSRTEQLCLGCSYPWWITAWWATAW